MRKPTVAIYSSTIPSSTFIERLIIGLAKEQYEVLLFGNKTKAVQYPKGVKQFVVPDSRAGLLFYGLWNVIVFVVKYPGSIGKFFKEIKNHNGWRLRYMVKILPIINNKPDVFHIQWPKTLDELLLLKNIFGMKLVLSLRGSHINYSPVLIPGLAEMYKQTFPEMDAFHAVSETMKEKSLQYGASSDKVQVIHSGIHEELYDLKINYEKYKDRNVLKIIAVGRNHWVKGYRYLIDALAICKKKNISFNLTLIGGNMDEDIKFQIYQQGLTQEVEILPALDNKEVINNIKDAHVLVCSSVEEGISNAVLEAMAVGTIVISTDCGGMHEVLSNGVNSYLVPKRDPNALCDAITTFLNEDTIALEMMAKRAQHTIREKFSEKNMISSFDQLYKSVMEVKN